MKDTTTMAKEDEEWTIPLFHGRRGSKDDVLKNKPGNF